MISSKVVLLFAIVSPFVSSTPLPEDGKGFGARIVGGSGMDISHAPYQISLQVGEFHVCGGAIISPQSILTSSHCIIGESASSLSVRAGSNNHAFGGEVVNVSQIHQHPNFDPETLDYDVAVLTLETPLTMGSSIPIASSPISTGSLVLGTGWGLASEVEDPSDTLLAVNRPIKNKSICQLSFGNVITNRMLCAGLPEGEKNVCAGDSGGPIVYDGEVVGIVSWGRGCSKKPKPAVYANVYNMRQFIQENTV